MAIITLRQSSVVADPSATIKNSPLTNAEVDNNFANINISSGVLSTLNTNGKANIVIAINELSSNLFGLTTGNVSEAIANLYFTNVRAYANLLNATTTALSEGDNLYFTNTRAIDTVEDNGLTMTSGANIAGQGLTAEGLNSASHVIGGTNVYSGGTITSASTAKIGGALLTGSFYSEEANIIVPGFADSGNLYNLLNDGPVHYHTGDATANANVNIIGIDGTMEVGNVVSAAVLITQGSSPKYVTGVMINGTQANVIRWSGGVVPSAGTAASNIDVYVFNIIKTGTSTFTVLGSQTQFGGTQG